MNIDIFELVKEKIDIVNVISKDEQLHKSNGELYGSHKAVHESEGKRCLWINERKQIYYCHHCGETGDVIHYVAQRDNCDEIEAAEWLCDTYNIPRPDWTPEQKAKHKQQRQEKKAVRPLIKECFEFYHDQMTDEQRDYYHSRGLTDDTIDDQLCGYAPSDNELFKHMINKYPGQAEQLLKTGLFFKFDSGIRDRNQNRYVIPYWHKGDIVFSIGRSIDPEAQAKYVKHLTHSDKYPYVSNVAVKHIIYNEDKIRGAEKVIITEGIFDVMLAIQAGYDAISPITTKFSNKDNERLAELTANAKTVYLLNDSEVSGAGIEGAIKTAKVLSKAGVKVKLGEIPRPESKDKVDLADFIVETGDEAKDKVDELLENAKILLNYQLDQIPQDKDRLELVTKIEDILKEAVKAGKSKSWLRQWLKVKVKNKFDLLVGELKDTYQPMLTDIVKEYEKAQKEQSRKEQVGTEEEGYFRDDTFIPKWLADELTNEDDYIFSASQLYVYRDGVYLPKGEVLARRECRKKLGADSRVNRLNEVIAHIEDLNYVEAQKLNTRRDLINLQNGMYNWIEDKLIPHDPKYLSTMRIPVEYDPKAKCPQVDKFFRTTLPPDCVPIVEELFGYAMIPDTSFEKAFMLLGGGANGKSTLLKLLEAFIGSANVSKVPLQEIADNRFKRAELHGKLINLFADLSSRAINSSSYFKAIVSGDSMNVERKHQDPFEFNPFCRLVFSANELPQSQDKTFAYYRRWIIIPFPYIFEGKRADKSLIHKITTTDELSGLLNKALTGLRRLFNQEAFSDSDTVNDELDDYKAQNDPIEAFVMDMTEFDTEAEVERQELFSEYCKYCKSESYKVENNRKFYDRLRAYQEITEIQHHKGERVFKGIKMKSQELGLGKLL